MNLKNIRKEKYPIMHIECIWIGAICRQCNFDLDKILHISVELKFIEIQYTFMAALQLCMTY